MSNNFEAIDVITPIIDFIKTCPFIDDYNIDLEDMSVQKLGGDEPEGSAIDYVGSVQLSSYSDIVNKGYSTRQANFNLWLLRKSGHDFYRKEIAEFIWNFEQWIEYCQYNGLTPKFSADQSDKREEVMFADNGVFFSDWEDEDSSLYMIQLHIIYYNRY